MRDDLGVAAARGAALHAEHGTERRLAQAEHRLPPEGAECPGSGSTDVVVFPSPAGVGVIAVHDDQLRVRRRSLSRSMTERSTFAL